jgi:hypothetical protein
MILINTDTEYKALYLYRVYRQELTQTQDIKHYIYTWCTAAFTFITKI